VAEAEPAQIAPLSSGRLGRWLKFGIALAVSVLFAWLFVRGLDLDEVADSLAGANYAYVAPALGLFALSVACRAARWRYFLLPSDDLSWRQLLPSVLIGYAGNNLLPLRAGELVRAQHLLDHHGVSRMRTFGALLMERLFDGVVLATFVLWGLLIVDVGDAYLGLGLLLAGASVCAFIVCTVVSRHPGLPGRIAALPLPFLTPRLRREIAGLGGSFLAGFTVLTSASRFLLATLTSIAAWGLELAMYLLIAEAFALDASLLEIAFAGAAANVAMSLPSAQGGVGPFQYFATQALLRAGVAGPAAAAYALALHMFLVAPVSLVGLAVLWRSTLPGARKGRVVAASPAPEPAAVSPNQ
jgi:uncharacterized protein (TIRG00374 family)